MNMNRRSGHFLTALSLGLGLSAGSIIAHAEIYIRIGDWPGSVAWHTAERQVCFTKYNTEIKLVWLTSFNDFLSAHSAGQFDANSKTWRDTLAPPTQEMPHKAMLVNDKSASNDAPIVGSHMKRFADLMGKTIELETFNFSYLNLVNAPQKNDMYGKGVTVINPATAAAK